VGTPDQATRRDRWPRNAERVSDRLWRGRGLREGQGRRSRDPAGHQRRRLWRPRLHLSRPGGSHLELRHLWPVV